MIGSSDANVASCRGGVCPMERVVHLLPSQTCRSAAVAALDEVGRPEGKQRNEEQRHLLLHSHHPLRRRHPAVSAHEGQHKQDRVDRAGAEDEEHPLSEPPDPCSPGRVLPSRWMLCQAAGRSHSHPCLRERRPPNGPRNKLLHNLSALKQGRVMSSSLPASPACPFSARSAPLGDRGDGPGPAGPTCARVQQHVGHRPGSGGPPPPARPR